MRKQVRLAHRPIETAFCPTGPGGGTDNSCGKATKSADDASVKAHQETERVTGNEREAGSITKISMGAVLASGQADVASRRGDHRTAMDAHSQAMNAHALARAHHEMRGHGEKVVELHAAATKAHSAAMIEHSKAAHAEKQAKEKKRKDDNRIKYGEQGNWPFIPD